MLTFASTMRSLLAIPLLFLATVQVGQAAPTSEIEGVSFPESIEVGETELPLSGLGLLRYRVVFRGYVGGLYLPKIVDAQRALDDVPKVLELSYFWAIKGRFFGEAANELLARSLSAERLASLSERLTKLHALYKDVEVGDRYRLTYAPNVGMTLSLNGRSLGTIPGADFASAYFGIWLGEQPLNESFRDQIFKGL